MILWYQEQAEEERRAPGWRQVSEIHPNTGRAKIFGNIWYSSLLYSFGIPSIKEKKLSKLSDLLTAKNMNDKGSTEQSSEVHLPY